MDEDLAFGEVEKEDSNGAMKRSGMDKGAEHLEEENKDHAADQELIDEHKLHLREIYTQAKSMKVAVGGSLNRQYARNDAVSESQSWNFYAMCIEAVCFVGIVAFQLYHIKKTLDNKLVM